MNHLAAAADGVDGVVRVLEPEAVRGDQIKLEAIGVQLFQCQLAAFEVMAARRLYGDVLVADFAQGKVGKFRDVLALDQQRAALALERLDAQQNRNRTRARRAIERHIHAFT